MKLTRLSLHVCHSPIKLQRNSTTSHTILGFIRLDLCHAFYIVHFLSALMLSWHQSQVITGELSLKVYLIVIKLPLFVFVASVEWPVVSGKRASSMPFNNIISDNAFDIQGSLTRISDRADIKVTFMK